MKYSVFYKIDTRYKFFERFCRRYIKTTNPAIRGRLIDSCEELMELVVKMILDNNMSDLTDMLLRQNAKHARIFFDHFVGAKTKHMKKTDIISTVENYFTKENDMKDIHAFLVEAVKPVKLSNQYVPFKLTEAEGNEDSAPDMADDGGDPFADDGSIDADPSGGDPFGDDSADDTGEDAETDEAEDNETEDEDPYDIEGHEDDPDFTKGGEEGDVVQASPAGAVVYDTEGVMKSINAVIANLSDEQLAEIEAVKKAATLIFNGKLLKPEDVTFKNPKNAAFLLKKIGTNVDEKTRNYLMLKIKQPLIKLRDKNKEELATMKNDTDSVRDTLVAL